MGLNIARFKIVHTPQYSVEYIKYQNKKMRIYSVQTFHNVFGFKTLIPVSENLTNYNKELLKSSLA